MKNRNHPKKGSVIKVGPIENVEDINFIKQMLSQRPRDFSVFTVGINVCLRGGDLLRLTVGQVSNLRVGDVLLVREGKTQKVREITINRAVFEAIQLWLNARLPCDDDAPLFPNYRTGKPLTVSTLNNMVKAWCKAAGLKGNYGSHTLRKTFGYHQRMTFQTQLPVLMVVYGHTSQLQTLTYLCITDTEIKSAYMHEI
jgi:integrase